MTYKELYEMHKGEATLFHTDFGAMLDHEMLAFVEQYPDLEVPPSARDYIPKPEAPLEDVVEHGFVD